MFHANVVKAEKNQMNLAELPGLLVGLPLHVNLTLE